MDIILLSTAVAPKFVSGDLHLMPVADLEEALRHVKRNLHGHMPTILALRKLCPDLPDPVREFWDGTGLALAVRPRGGVRGGGDVELTINDLECVYVEFSEKGWPPLHLELHYDDDPLGLDLSLKLRPSEFDRHKWGCPRCGWPLDRGDDQGDGGVTCVCGAWVPLPSFDPA